MDHEPKFLQLNQWVECWKKVGIEEGEIGHIFDSS